MADIFRMERAHALLRTIGTRAAILNDRTRGNFGELFNSLQTALTADCVIAVARIYDPPSRRYPTRCMRYVLEFLRKNREELPSIRERYQLELALRAAGVEAQLAPFMSHGPARFADALVDHFLAILESEDTQRAIEALKTLRDKAIAHNEDVETVAGPTWQSLSELVRHAKYLVGILGWASLDTAYFVNGEFILSEDAVRADRALNRLIGQVYGAAANSVT